MWMQIWVWVSQFVEWPGGCAYTYREEGIQNGIGTLVQIPISSNNPI